MDSFLSGSGKAASCSAVATAILSDGAAALLLGTCRALRSGKEHLAPHSVCCAYEVHREGLWLVLPASGFSEVVSRVICKCKCVSK